MDELCHQDDKGNEQWSIARPNMPKHEKLLVCVQIGEFSSAGAGQAQESNPTRVSAMCYLH